MEIFIVKSKFGYLVGVYTTREKAEERMKRIGGGYIIKTNLDTDTMIKEL